MFRELGEFITKRPWVIIALWIIIVFAAAPFAATLSDNLKYSASAFMPTDTDSSRAQDVYNQQFSTGNSSQLIVVIDSGNPERTKAFINSLNQSVWANSSIKQFNSTASIYGIQRSALAELTPDLHCGLIEAQDNVSEVNHKLYEGIDGVRNASDGLYGLWDNVTKINSGFYDARRQILQASDGLYSARDQIVQGHDGLYQIKGASDMLLGVPASFVQAYGNANSSLDDANRSLEAYNTVKGQVAGTPASGYLDAFYHAWTAGSGEPMARAQSAIRSSDIASYIGAMPAEQQPLMQSIVNTFPISNYPGGERDFCVNTAAGMQNLTDPAMKQQLYVLYDLGSSPSGGDYDNLVLNMAAAKGGVDRNSIGEIYNLGRHPSDDTIGHYLVDKTIAGIKDSAEGRNMSAADMHNASDMIHDAWSLGGQATRQDFDSYVLKKAEKGLNATEKQSVEEIWGMGKNPNDTVIVNYVLDQAGKNGSMNRSQLDAARDIIALGRNATNDSIQAYLVKEVMKNMNLTGNGSYFLAVANLDRHMDNSSLRDYGADWADTHGIDNPRLLPDSVTKNMVSNNTTLFVVSLDADDIADQLLVEGDVGVLRGIISDVKEKGDFTDVRAYVTGDGAMNADTDNASTADMENIDKYTILLVMVLLLYYFRSVLTPFVPLVAIGIAIAVTFGVIGLVSHFVSLYYIVELFTLVIMLGAGIDYCVFLLSRYAEERREGAGVKAAVITTVEHAGKSIVSSGLTAALGFGSLILTGSGMFLSMGLGVAIGLLISVAMTVTLIPAVLTIVGDRIFWPNKIHNTRKNATFTGIWGGIVEKVVRHPVLIVVLAVLLTIPAIALTTELQTGMDIVQMLPGNVESKIGFSLLQDSMGSGAMTRTMITVTLPVYINDTSGNRSQEALDRIEAISARVANVSDVDRVYSLTRPDGERINYTDLDGYSGMEKQYYETYMDNNTGRDNRTTLIYASFKGSPYSNEALDSIDQMRAALQNNSSGALQGAEIHVGGATALNKDIVGTMTSGFYVVLPIVVIGIIIILLVLLKSALTPLRIVLTLGTSIIWTIAAFVLVFQLHLHSIMIFMLPIMLFISLMGMGVDYDIFLVTRIREEKLKGLSNRDAIVKAVDRTGTIITMCGAIMAGAFGTLMLSDQMMMQQIGFILFVAVAIDATVMRLMIVPAIMTLMGEYNWWLPRLRRREPPVIVAKIEDKTKQP